MLQVLFVVLLVQFNPCTGKENPRTVVHSSTSILNPKNSVSIAVACCGGEHALVKCHILVASDTCNHFIL